MVTNLIKEVKFKTLIIIPTFNSEKSIDCLLSNLQQFNVLVVDDGSKDNTKQILKSRNTKFIDFERNKGVGHAIKAGIHYALENNYEYAITIDSDGQHETKYIHEFLSRMNHDSFIIGNRFQNVKYIPHQKICSNLFAQIMFKHLFKKRFYDVSCGYRAFRVEKELFNCTANDYGYLYEHLILSIINNRKIEYINMPARYRSDDILCTRASEILGLLKAINTTPNINRNAELLLDSLIRKFGNRETVNIEIDSYLFWAFYFKEYDAYIFQTDIQKAIEYFKSEKSYK